MHLMPALVLAALSLVAAGCSAARTVSSGPAPAGDVLLVTSTAEDGPGSLREAINEANRADSPIRIDFSLGSEAVISISRELPHVKGPGTHIDGAGVTLIDADCVRHDGRTGCSGLTISGPNVTVRGLTSKEFLFDGISVAGEEAVEVSILDCSCEGNRDDGIGISARAKGVLVEGCRVSGNGFRTKGKGILVFDHAEATLRDNVVERNRDGITISKRAVARLESNLVSENFDKGVGVSGATLTGQANEIINNGTGDNTMRAPNGDGLRVSLISQVKLEDTVVVNSGDAGVVVLGDSTVTLIGGRIESNGGAGVVVRGRGRLGLIGVAVRDNGGGGAVIEEQGVLSESP